MQQITAWKYLKDAIKYFFSRKKYINKYYIVHGKKRQVIGETCYNVFFRGIKESIPKAYLKTIQKPKINPYKKQVSPKSPMSHSSQN